MSDAENGRVSQLLRVHHIMLCSGLSAVRSSPRLTEASNILDSE